MAKKTTTKELPNLNNATPGYLVDELGSTREAIKELQQKEGYLKQALMARLDGKSTVEGDETHNALISEVSQMRINSQGLKDEFGQEWYDEHCKLVEYRKVSTSRKLTT